MGDLPKGLRLDHNYVQVRIMHKGRYYHRNFGLDSPLARELAIIHLAEKRKEILMGKFGITKELPERTFASLVPVYMKKWTNEKNGDGAPKHPERSVKERQRVFDKVLIPYFGKFKFQDIRTIDVEKWREKRLSEGVLGTSVNREMVPLGDMFSTIEQMVATEQLEAIKLPDGNPCKNATKAALRVRERVLTDYELRKLHLAFTTLKDEDGWQICLLALWSILSPKDLRKLELGSTIDLERSKSGVPIHIPITLLQTLNWRNWKKRWNAARIQAGLPDVQFGRDLRKTGGNKLVGQFDIKLVSQYFGHSTVKTTEKSYTITQTEKMRPLAEFLETWAKSL